MLAGIKPRLTDILIFGSHCIAIRTSKHKHLIDSVSRAALAAQGTYEKNLVENVEVKKRKTVRKGSCRWITSVYGYGYASRWEEEPIAWDSWGGLSRRFKKLEYCNKERQKWRIEACSEIRTWLIENDTGSWLHTVIKCAYFTRNGSLRRKQRWKVRMVACDNNKSFGDHYTMTRTAVMNMTTEKLF